MTDLAGLPAAGLANWLADLLAGWLAELSGLLTGGLADWLTGWLCADKRRDTWLVRRCTDTVRIQKPAHPEVSADGSVQGRGWDWVGESQRGQEVTSLSGGPVTAEDLVAP